MARADKNGERFEAMIRRALKNAPAAARPDCPGPEVLAAYYDRSLSRVERSLIDTHLLQCARCQSAMASIARADDSSQEKPAAAPAWFWISRILAPVAVMGILIVIAVKVRNNEPSRRPMEVAMGSPQSASKFALAERAQAPAAAQPNSSELQGESDQMSASSAQPRLKSQEFKGKDLERRALAKTATAETAAKEASPAAPVPAPMAAANSLSGGLAGVGSGRGELRSMRAANAAGSASAPAAGAAVFGTAAPRVQVYSPDRSAGWELGGAGIIMRWTTSGGWRPQVSGVSADLLAGSAPSESLCWVVGKSGTVLRTTDGGDRWQKLTPPSGGDLVSVTARSAKAASIVADDGQKFSTRDGGVTWSSP